MLNAVIRFALRNRVLIVFLSLAALLYGGYAATTLPIDVFPDLDRPRVVVMTEAPGLAPEEVETLVTFPLEAALLGATGVEDVRSQSAVGLSVVYVEFGWGTDIRTARQVVQERLATAQPDLPSGVRPQMAPISSIMGQIMLVGIYRRPGPRGGELAPLGTTGHLAELVHDPAEGRATVYLWEPHDRGRPNAWRPIRTDAASASLTWELPPVGPWAEAVAADRVERLVLRPVPGSPGAFTATDPRLRVADKDRTAPGRPADRERRVTVAVGGATPTAVFPPAAQRKLKLRTTADWVVRPRLLKVRGIAQVMVMGGGRKQYQVLVDPTALLAYDVSLAQVEEAVRRNNVNASGGFAVQADRERPVRVLGRLGPDTERVLDQLRQVPVKPTAERTVLLAQVARVVEGAQVKRGDASVNGLPAVVLVITKQPHVDTRVLTDRVVAALREVEAALPADVVVNPELYQLREFIDRGLFNVGEALVIGAGLVLIVLFLFLLNLRTTFISLTAIPLSLAVTALVFQAVGWLTGTVLSINVMTLGGIAVAMGELVDDAIVDVENIFRRLKENNALPPSPLVGEGGGGVGGVYRRPALAVIYEASVEVRSAIVYGTVLVILVFVPLFALSGVEGRLFAPLGVAYIVSILASLLVSLTVTPVLSYYLLPQARATHRTHDSPLLRALKWAAGGLIRLSMARTGWILLATWLLVGLGVVVLTRLGADFLPRFDEGSAQVNLTLPAGSSLEASNEVAAVVDARLRRMQKSAANPGGLVLQFSRRTGRAELDEHAEPVSRTEYIVTVNPDAGVSREDALKRIEAAVKEEVAGVDVEVEQPLSHLISHMLSGVTAQVAIKIHGDDLETLRRLAGQVKAAIGGVAGIAPPVVEAQQEVEELHIRLRPGQLAFHGVDRAHVAEFVSTALKGEVVSQVVEGQRRFDLLVRLDKPYQTDYASLGRLSVDLPGGRGRVPLSELADIGGGGGANQISRENARRRIVVRVNARDRDLASVVEDIEKRIDEQVRPGLPPGYFIEYGGQFESQRRATWLILALAGVALAGMFAVLYTLYPSARIVLQILNALPTAFIGGVAALALTGQTLTVAAMVGFISLGGIAARNGILLVTHYFHLMRHEKEGFTRQMVLRGSLERLAPVLMTALTAGIGLVPLVVGGHQPGREILYPVATVILGGLITSTLSEFLLHPGLFWNFSGRDAVRIARADAAEGEVG
ncbi:MAG: efflux RND transporter permease subunit [Gemmataceae bacterium]|nr:efflux RND transporter permease subunit [Gemmataceae bacterium]